MKSVDVWAEQFHAPFDQAGKGKSALGAALSRNIYAEVDELLSPEVISIFNDFKSFLTPLTLLS